jgi:hypothetical protein
MEAVQVVPPSRLTFILLVPASAVPRDWFAASSQTSSVAIPVEDFVQLAPPSVERQTPSVDRPRSTQSIFDAGRAIDSGKSLRSGKTQVHVAPESVEQLMEVIPPTRSLLPAAAIAVIQLLTPGTVNQLEPPFVDRESHPFVPA